MLLSESRLLDCVNATDFCNSYRLFLLSFAVQHALDNPELLIDLSSYCVLSFESASNMIAIARDYLGPLGVLRYGIDSTYVYLSYAATFLLKVCLLSSRSNRN